MRLDNHQQAFFQVVAVNESLFERAAFSVVDYLRHQTTDPYFGQATPSVETTNAE